jgi:hypothetical protein
MMTNLTWSALLLAALVVVAWWNGEDRRGCDESRPPFGAEPCCQRHRAGARPSAGFEAKLEAERGLVVPGDRR